MKIIAQHKVINQYKLDSPNKTITLIKQNDIHEIIKVTLIANIMKIKESAK